MSRFNAINLNQLSFLKDIVLLCYHNLIPTTNETFLRNTLLFAFLICDSSEETDEAAEMEDETDDEFFEYWELRGGDDTDDTDDEDEPLDDYEWIIPEKS